MTPTETLPDSEIRFARRAVGRRRLFLALAVAGVVVAAGLSGYYGWRFLHDPAFPIAPRAVIVLLVLLNARQNLRQYRYAGVLQKMMRAGVDTGPAAAS